MLNGSKDKEPALHQSSSPSKALLEFVLENGKLNSRLLLLDSSDLLSVHTFPIIL